MADIKIDDTVDITDVVCPVTFVIGEQRNDNHSCRK